MPKRSQRARGQVAWEQLLTNVDRQHGTLHEQLVRTFVDAIDAGRIASGVRVPSGRELARMLGIGRNTAALALADLVQRGYMFSRERSGVFVAERRTPPARADGGCSGDDVVDWSSRLQVDIVPIAARTHEPETGRPHLSFLNGEFDSGLFPAGHWRECERAALSVLEIAEWGKNRVDADDPALIEALRKHILPSFGIWANSDEIIVTLGGQEARYLIGRLLCGRGRTVGVEDPGMPDMVSVLKLTGASAKPLALDEQGIVVARQLDGCDVVVTTCGHQCPTTAVMPLERRQAMLDSACRNDFLVIEDTYETELVIDGGLPSLKGLDAQGRVIHLGSLSKILAPGLRIGYIVAPPAVILQLRELRRLIHRHAPGNNQRALAMFIDRGYHRVYMQRMEAELLKRAGLLRESMRVHMPEVDVRHSPCSPSLWMTGPDGLSAEALADEAARRGVLIEPGTRFFHDRADVSSFRMGVASASGRQIELGVRLLGQAYRAIGR